MCGIVGIVAGGAVGEAQLRSMAGELAHRGPDDEGLWMDARAGIGFGHRRLSIVDLSPAGHQPMTSGDGRWTITFNGEIYNHVELRAELETGGGGPAPAGGGWRGHSDTETLLECISAWGLERTIARAAGMFALALWDAKERKLHLLRDRMGEKPLYYGWAGGRFVFASELEAIRRVPCFDNGLSPRAVALFTRLGNIPAPHSIFERVYKLQPGCILSAAPDELQAPSAEPPAVGGRLVRRYWCYANVVRSGLEQPFREEEAATDALEEALLRAVRQQAVADVPVGAFLSGGIDSSTVVALMRRHTAVSTFTIGFEDRAFDEAPYARAVADHLGTQHHEACVTAAEAREVIPLLPRMYDEPFADSSQIPTYLVSKHARGQVKVALSGDGGDEVFGGYNRHLAAAGLWSKVGALPRPARAAFGTALGRIPAGAWNAGADLLRRRSRQPHFGAKVQKALRTMGRASGVEQLYDSFVDEWFGEAAPVLADGSAAPSTDAELGPAPDPLRMMHRDAITYLPDDVLTKVDRAAMAVSLETRLPLLDHGVLELAARIPLPMKISGGVGKKVLRRVLFRHVPAALFERPKTGFAVPIGEWLRGPLRPWAEELLDERRLRDSGLLRPEPIRARWSEHLAGRADWAASLWFILMFEAWRERSLSPARAIPSLQTSL
ncbi:MAG TPA: asparagine synthase (glutamine-hydrolyzing) [Allosphingosinicella sp.]|jgi:asparagine synthase (glutamine-hydrolysing)